MGGLVGGKPDTSAASLALFVSLRLQREETKRAREAAQAEKRDLQTEMAAKSRARRGGGKRALLASRVTPEAGIQDEDKNLGTQ